MATLIGVISKVLQEDPLGASAEEQYVARQLSCEELSSPRMDSSKPCWLSQTRWSPFWIQMGMRSRAGLIAIGPMTGQGSLSFSALHSHSTCWRSTQGLAR